MTALFAMINISLQKTISWVTVCINRMHKAFCCRQMILTISPVAPGTTKHRSDITLSPSGFIKNNGYREVF